MKNLKHLFAAFIMFAVTLSAWAGPNVKDVEAAMRAKNWQGAETMLNQVLAAKPNSAKAHYLMAQVHEQTGRKGSALSELNQARQNDPSLKFASRGAVDKMAARLDSSTNSYAATAPPSKPAYVPQATASQSYTPTVAAAAHPVVGGEKSSGGGFGMFLVFLLIVLAASAGIYFYLKNKEKKAEAERVDAERRSWLARAVDLLTQAHDLQKTVKYEAQESSSLGAAVKGLVSQASSVLATLKTSGNTYSSSNVERSLRELETQMNSATVKIAQKEWEPKPAPYQSVREVHPKAAVAARAIPIIPQPSVRTVRQPAPFDQDAYDRKQREVQREADERERERQSERDRNRNNGGNHNHYHNNGGSDIVTTVLAASVLSSMSGNSHGSNHSSGGNDGWSNGNSQPAYEAPAPQEAPEMDFGGSDSWEDDSKKSSGSSYSEPEPDRSSNNDSGSNDTSSSDDGF